MVPTHLNSSTSPAALNQDHQLEPYNTSKPDQASSSSCLSTHAFTFSIQDQGGFYPKEPLSHLQYQQEPNNLAINGVSDDNSAPICENNRGLKFSLSKKEEGYGNQTGSAKWMCSKMAMNSVQMSSEAQTNALIMKFEDEKLESSSPLENDNGSHNSSSSNSNNPVRVCSACNTTKTPLWRSGPKGPKSLCNACGIRQRKARKAMAVAAVAAAAATTTTTSNDTVSGTENSPLKIKLQHKAKRCKNGLVSQCKKRSKLANPIPHGRKKLCFEKFLMNLSKNLALPQVFPQDEKEAAILLMALSCGLVHG